MPGCPELACCTASIASVRIVLMHKVSKAGAPPLLSGRAATRSIVLGSTGINEPYLNVNRCRSTHAGYTGAVTPIRVTKRRPARADAGRKTPQLSLTPSLKSGSRQPGLHHVQAKRSQSVTSLCVLQCVARVVHRRASCRLWFPSGLAVFTGPTERGDKASVSRAGTAGKHAKGGNQTLDAGVEQASSTTRRRCRWLCKGRQPSTRGKPIR